MRRIACAFLLISFFLNALGVHAADAATRIADGTNVQGMWSADDSPYIVEGKATVPKYGTLTIEPGVEVRLAVGENRDCTQPGFDVGVLHVRGRLVAAGTAARPIVFTRDGSAGYWGCIVFVNSHRENVLRYCTVEYASGIRNLVDDATLWGGVVFYHCAAAVSDCVFHHNWRYGIRCHDRATPTISHCLFFRNEDDGMLLADSSPRLEFNTFVSNAGYGVWGNSASAPDIRNCLFWDNVNGSLSDFPATVSSSLLGDATLPNAVIDGADNIFSRNPRFVAADEDDYRLRPASPARGAAADGADLGARIRRPLGEAAAVPTSQPQPSAPPSGNSLARLHGSPGSGHAPSASPVTGPTHIATGQQVFGEWRAEGSPYIIQGEAIIPEGRELTIHAGVRVEFHTGDNNEYDEAAFDLGFLRVNGRLSVRGTSARQVYFTRHGDSGNWGVILFRTADTGSIIEHARIEYAWRLTGFIPDHGSYGAVSLHNSFAALRHCYLVNNREDAIYCDAAAPEIVHCTVADNGDCAIEAYYEGGPRISNSLFWGNQRMFCFSDGQAAVAHTLVQVDELPSGVSDEGGNILGRDPLFVHGRGGDYRLRPGSPAAGRGADGSDMGVGAISLDEPSGPPGTAYSSDRPHGETGPTYVVDKEQVYGRWTRAGSPYVIQGEAIVPEGRQLIIEAGVTVELRTGSHNVYSEPSFDLGLLRINGRLRVLGTTEQLVHFTRHGSAGNWGVILFRTDDPDNLIERAWIEHGWRMTGFFADRGSYGAVSIHQSQVTIRHSFIVDNREDAIYCDGAEPELVHNTIVNNGDCAIEAYYEARPRISSSLFWDNGRMFCFSNGYAAVRHCLIQEQSLPEGVDDQGGNLLGLDPRLRDASSGDYSLGDGSPALAAAADGADMGAYGTGSVAAPPPAAAVVATTPEADSGGFLETLPPILKIEDIALSRNVLEAGETAELAITLSNVGPGIARDVYASISGELAGITYPKTAAFPEIAAGGGRQTMRISISGREDLGSGQALLRIEIVDPHFRVKIQGKQLRFATRELRRPELILAKFAVVESQSANPNNQIDLNEIIDLKFAIQNVGAGAAQQVDVAVTNSQPGVMLLGVVDGGQLLRKNPFFASIAPGKYETVIYRYFVNSEFDAPALDFRVTAREKMRSSGLEVDRQVAINTQLRAEGYIRQVALAEAPAETAAVIIEDIPDFVVDIRRQLPHARRPRPDAVAVVIGNRDYKSRDVPAVDYALDDALMMKQYLVEAMGFDPHNVLYYTNATQADFNAIFGTRENYKGRLFDYVRPGQSEVFVYYSGHGAPDPESKKGYFVPIDCDPSHVALNGYSLETLYRNLGKIRSKSLTVVIDACFSGSSERGMLLHNASPLFIRVEDPALQLANAVILTSATGDQISSWYPAKHHSLFTYFFLKALQGAGDADGDQRITLGEVRTYIDANVPYLARRLHSRKQTPQISGDDDRTLVEF